MNLNRWGNNPTFRRPPRKQRRWKHKIFLFIFILIFLIPMHFDTKTTSMSDGTDEVDFCFVFVRSQMRKNVHLFKVSWIFVLFFNQLFVKMVSLALNGRNKMKFDLWSSICCWLIVDSFHFVWVWPCHCCQ